MCVWLNTDAHRGITPAKGQQRPWEYHQLLKQGDKLVRWLGGWGAVRAALPEGFYRLLTPTAKEKDCRDLEGL